MVDPTLKPDGYRGGHSTARINSETTIPFLRTLNTPVD